MSSTAALGVFVAGFSSILTGLNFIVTIHRMRAPGMTWNAPPAVHLVALRHQHHSGSRHPGRRHHHRSGCRSSALFHLGSLQSQSGRRSAPVPAPVLVLFPPGRLHHDSARHGHRQRDRLPASRASASSDTSPWRSPSIAHRRLRIPGLGAPHVRRRHLASMPRWSFLC